MGDSILVHRPPADPAFRLAAAQQAAIGEEARPCSSRGRIPCVTSSDGWRWKVGVRHAPVGVCVRGERWVRSQSICF